MKFMESIVGNRIKVLKQNWYRLLREKSSNESKDNHIEIINI